MLFVGVHIDIFMFTTPIGNLEIKNKNGIISSVIFVNENKDKDKDNDENIPFFIWLDEVKAEFEEYFKGSSEKMEVKGHQSGTKFQKMVWQEISKIPYGETRTYGNIAESINLPKSYRGVASACGMNRLAIIIPCHRVVGKKDLGGYRWGVEKKKWLLAFEKSNKSKFP